MSKYIDGVYTADTFAVIFTKLLNEYNLQNGTNFSESQIKGTPDGNGLYIITQFLLTQENDFMNIAITIEDYIKQLNLTLLNAPTTFQSRIDIFNKKGYKVAVDDDATGVLLAVFKEGVDFATNEVERNKVANIYHDTLAGGLVTLGSLSGSKQLTNGQVFSYNFDTFTDTPLYLKYTITYSPSTTADVVTAVDIKSIVLVNFNKMYGYGGVATPYLYLTEDDIPYSLNIKSEYSTNGVDYFEGVLTTTFNTRLTLDIGNIIIELELVD